MLTDLNNSPISEAAQEFSFHKTESAHSASDIAPIQMKQAIAKRNQVDREAFLLAQLLPSEDILHLGCSDAPFTESQIRSGNLLHAKLLNRAPKVVGHDISGTHLNLLRQNFPQSKFVQGDVEALQTTFAAASFDLIIAGEILEHLFNPGNFFANCKHTLKPGGRLLLTVPNAFGFRRWIHNVLGVENYHPEHTFYFSENTISYLARQCGFEVVQSLYYPTATNQSKLKFLLYLFVEQIPAKLFGNHLLDGLILDLRPIN